MGTEMEGPMFDSMEALNAYLEKERQYAPYVPECKHKISNSLVQLRTGRFYQTDSSFQGLGSLERLPRLLLDIIFFNIPPQDIMNSRLVSRAWHDKLSSRDLLNAYNSRSKYIMISLIARRDTCFLKASQLAVFDVKFNRWSLAPAFTCPKGYQLVGGGQGLLLFWYRTCSDSLMVGNPLTGTYKHIHGPLTRTSCIYAALMPGTSTFQVFLLVEEWNSYGDDGRTTLEPQVYDSLTGSWTCGCTCTIEEFDPLKTPHAWILEGETWYGIIRGDFLQYNIVQDKWTCFRMEQVLQSSGWLVVWEKQIFLVQQFNLWRLQRLEIDRYGLALLSKWGDGEPLKVWDCCSDHTGNLWITCSHLVMKTLMLLNLNLSSGEWFVHPGCPKPRSTHVEGTTFTANLNFWTT